MKRVGVLLYSVALCGTILCQFSYADGKESDPIRFSVDLFGQYTDNRDSAEDGMEEETWDLYIKPRLDLIYHGQRSLVDFYYAPSYRYRTDPSPLQNDYELGHDLSLSAKFRPTRRMELRASDKFDYTDDPSIDEGGQTLRGDRSYMLNRVEAGLIHQVTPRSNVDVFGQYRAKRYDEQLAADESDEDLVQAGLRVWSQISKSVEVKAYASYATYGFEDLFSLERDFTSASGGLGLTKRVNKMLSAGADVGVQSQEYDSGALDSQIVPYGKAWVKGYTTPATELYGEISHGVREADAYPFASQEYTEARIGVEWDANARLTFDLDGVYRLSSYEEQEGLVAAAAGDLGLAVLLASLGSQHSGDETTIEAQGKVTYRVTDKTSVSLIQRFEDVDSDVGVSFSKNSTTLALSKSF